MAADPKQPERNAGVDEYVTDENLDAQGEYELLRGELTESRARERSSGAQRDVEYPQLRKRVSVQGARLRAALDVGTERALAIVVVAGGFVAVIGGALRRAGTPRRLVWLAGGMALGVLGLGLA